VTEALREAETRRLAAAAATDSERRIELGQVFTPGPVARFLVSMFDLRDGPASLLDPGAGVGSLTAAFVDRWIAEERGALEVTACEIDPLLHDSLRGTLNHCAALGAEGVQLVDRDFIDWSVDHLTGFGELTSPRFTHVIMNPPYRKMARQSRQQDMLRACGVEVPNVYAAFLALGVRLLAPGGQMVAITPRSFANGAYFRSFREDFLSRASLRRIHVYDTRDTAFADAEVLQENIVFLAERSAPGPVAVSSSSSPASESVATRIVPYNEVVRPDDPHRFIHLSVDENHATVASTVAALPSTLVSLGIAVSTGRVVDFRAREHLSMQAVDGCAPLVYPTHMRNGHVEWPKDGRKPNGLKLNDDTAALLLPAGCYVIVKRFSAKEERRRVVAAVVRTGDLPGERWAFENHLNVFHQNNGGLDERTAVGLMVWLNSTAVDVAFRQFSGHTQVNATDLRSMKYPTTSELAQLGEAAGSASLTQEKVDALVTTYVSGL
jgi:adenine-specific DNA-methyltransferase